MLIVVVFPAPLGPRNPKTSPGSTENETPRTASTSPNVLRSSLTSIIHCKSTATATNVQSTLLMEGLRERKKRETRDAIAAAALALFLERGFDAVTVADVGVAANVSEKTVFNYFATKEDL